MMISRRHFYHQGAKNTKKIKKDLTFT